jgi:hypothetical protein
VFDGNFFPTPPSLGTPAEIEREAAHSASILFSAVFGMAFRSGRTAMK